MKLLGSHASPYARKVRAFAVDLGDWEWYRADRPTLAGVACGAGLDWLSFRLPQFDWPRDHPVLVALMRRLAMRPSFASTEPSA